MKIPCETCISYAICKTRRVVDCPILWNTIELSHENIFKRAKVVMPNLRQIKSGNVYVSSNPPHYHMKGEMIKT